MTVAVDFDGVLHGYSEGWRDGTCYDGPVPGAIEGLRTLMADHAVFVFTARDPQQAGAWLRQHAPDIATTYEDPAQPSAITQWNFRRRLLITNRKLPATHYIDDRAVRFTCWQQALAAVDGRHGAAAPTIPIRVPADARPLTVGGIRTLQPDHVLYGQPCPVDGRPLGAEPITLVHVGTHPDHRKDTGWATGAAVAVHAACTGLDLPGVQQ